MFRGSLRLVTLAALIALVSASGMALLADPADDLQTDRTRQDRIRPQPVRWVPCPVPSCMAPCIWPPQPEVICRAPNGQTTVTSFTCCCCGGSAGYTFRRFH